MKALLPVSQTFVFRVKNAYRIEVRLVWVSTMWRGRSEKQSLMWLIDVEVELSQGVFKKSQKWYILLKNWILC